MKRPVVKAEIGQPLFPPTHQMLCQQEGKNAEHDAQRDIGKGDGELSVLDERKRFQRKGGECRKAAAYPRLEKEDKARVKAALTPRQTDDGADGETAKDVDSKRSKRKTAPEFRHDLSQQKTQNRSDRTAKPDGEDAHCTAPARKCATSFMRVNTAKPSSSKRMQLTAVLS